LKSLHASLFLGFKNAEKVFLHRSSRLDYPSIKPIPLPSNVEDIVGAEKSRFSPQRHRDINGSLIEGAVAEAHPADIHILSYDCSGSIKLNSAMQTSVPQPCIEAGFYTHFNMPGGLLRQADKYVAADQLRSCTFVRNYSTNSSPEEKPQDYSSLSRKEKLKTAVKEYGSVVIVFHVGISLISLGISYLAVTR